MPDDSFAPYAPPSSIISIINRQRKQGLPVVVDKGFLIRFGISTALVGRVIQALRFLKLTGENDEQLESLEQIKRLDDDGYKNLLEQLLQTVYFDVFEVVDLAEVTEKQLENAFRRYEPAGQRSRMITLFLRLCAEAGMMPETGIVKSPTPKRLDSPRTREQPAVKSASQRKQSVKDEGLTLSMDYSSEDVEKKVYEEQLLKNILEQLPEDRIWNTKKRGQWLQALTASIDLLIENSDDLTTPLMITNKI